MIKRQTWREYAESYDDRKIAIEAERIARRTFYHRMMDIWGEADKTLRAWKMWKDDPEETKRASVEKHADSLNRACYFIYNDPNATLGMKVSLRIAEWELNDFIFWDNSFSNTEETAMRWFNQWCYDYSKDLRIL